MNTYFRKATVFAAIAALTLHPILAQAQVAVGNANKIVAAVRGVLQTNSRDLVAKDAVFSDEVVNTGADSAARFIFRDNTMLSIGANSAVTLDKFVFDVDASNSTVALSMSTGVMRFVSGNLPKKVYSIRTPTALIGIRGTILVVTVGANGLTTVSVVEGVATVSGAGTTTTVNSGFTTTVSQGAPPAPPSATPPAPPQLNAMQTALGPEPGTATGSSQAGVDGLGGLSAGAIAGLAALAAALAVAIGIAASDNDSISTTDASSSTATSTN